MKNTPVFILVVVASLMCGLYIFADLITERIEGRKHAKSEKRTRETPIRWRIVFWSLALAWMCLCVVLLIQGRNGEAALVGGLGWFAVLGRRLFRGTR
jgi:L-asparagine transporter-like permease